MSEQEFYSPGQLSVIYPYIKTWTPRWLLLGGPADANEAQTAVARWPGINVIGVELNEEAVKWQLAHDWPRSHFLFYRALAERTGDDVHVALGSIRNGCVVEPSEENKTTVLTISWDKLDSLYGPFSEAILWMDIEGSEYKALLGARNLFERGAIRLVNIEQMVRNGDKSNNIAADQFLHHYGFVPVHDWNKSETCWDRIFVRKDDA